MPLSQILTSPPPTSNLPMTLALLYFPVKGAILDTDFAQCVLP